MLLGHDRIDSVDGVSDLRADRIAHEACIEALLAVVIHELCSYTIRVVHFNAVLEECGGHGLRKEVSILAHGIDALDCVFFPRIIGNAARTICPEVDAIRMKLLCCVCDADGVLLGEVGREPIIDPLGRLKNGIEFGTLFWRQEAINHVLRNGVRDEVEDVSGVCVISVLHGIRVCHLACGFVLGDLYEKGFIVFNFFSLVAERIDLIQEYMGFLVRKRNIRAALRLRVGCGRGGFYVVRTSVNLCGSNNRLTIKLVDHGPSLAEERDGILSIAPSPRDLRVLEVRQLLLHLSQLLGGLDYDICEPVITCGVSTVPLVVFLEGGEARDEFVEDGIRVLKDRVAGGADCSHFVCGGTLLTQKKVYQFL